MANHDYKLIVSVNQDVCVGAGLCVLSTDEVFDQRDEDGVVKLVQNEPPEELYEKVLGAVRKCPSKAIKAEQIPKENKEA
ncbi:ferredoxin [Vreelandella titanicae]|uniref:ferredoxin n=1 Tax=Vreelandella titanicae TaxID=664683 RepID=UPI000587C7FF|nr:ferredoxin [Halomonas titanicae]